MPEQVTELLYHKQTQLEQLSSERHVQQMTYERSLSAARADADRQKRSACPYMTLGSSFCMCMRDILKATAATYPQAASLQAPPWVCICRQSKSDRAAMVYMEEGELLVPLDTMGDAFQRLAHHKRMGKYVTASARCAIARLCRDLA